MATQYTSLLGLALPVTGELSGTWGDTVNDSITSLLDSAVAGTTTLNTDADVTLSTTTGATNQARQAIILWTANGTTTRNITAPAQSKAYVVINKSAGTQSIVFRAVGPTTGVTIAKNEAAIVAWNGSDFIKVSNINGTGTFTDLDVTGTTTLDALTASTALALNASKEIVSVTNTGTGNNVLATSPTLTTPNLGTPSAVTLTNATGLPVSTGISGLGSGVATFLATPSSANLAAAVTDETGSGALVFATSPALTTPNLGTPSALTLTNATGLPVATGISGLGSGVATFLATPSSANLAAAVTDETGTGALVFGTSPTLTTPNISSIVNTGTLTLPTSTDTLVGRATTDTLTNKTLTSPVISSIVNTGTLTLPTSTDTLVGRATTDTLTNKTINLANNTLTATSAQIAAAVTDETGSGALVFATSPTLTTPNLGTPSAVTLTNATGLPVSTGISGLGANVATFLATPSSANLAAAVTDETGSGALVFGTSPSLTTPAISGGTIDNAVIGGTTRAAGNFTTLNANGNVTLGDASSDTITLTGTVQPGVVISGSSSGDALRITQTGAGNALVVEDSANPDSTPFVINSSGVVVVGNTSAISGSTSATPIIQAQGSTYSTSSIGSYVFNSSGSNCGIEIGNSRGASVGSQGVVNSGDILGSIRFSGSDGTGFIRGATILSEVDGTPGTNDMPGRLVFSTTADGASTPTERLRISANGLSTFGSQAATGAALSTTAPAKIYTGTGTYTDSSTAASGTVTHGTINAFDNPAIAASNTTVTYTNASTLYIDGAPTAGTNVTITNPYSLFVNSGTVWLGGNVTGTDPVVQQSDIGSGPNEIPLNQYLGALAYLNTETPALDVGTGITGGTGTICKANGGLMGGIYQMTVLIDLTGLNSGGTAGDIIGVNGTANPCYIARLPAMTVLGGRMTCLETPAGGDTDIDLYSAAEGTGVEDQAITALTETEIINAGAQTRGTVTYFSADPAANAYFYLVGQGTANATYTAGRFLIEIFGV